MDFLGPLDTARANLKQTLEGAFAKLDEYNAYPELRFQLEGYFVFCGGISILKSADNYLQVMGENALRFNDLKQFTNHQISLNVNDVAVAVDKRRAEITDLTNDVKAGRYTDNAIINGGYCEIDDDFNKARDKAFASTNTHGKAENLARDVNTAMLEFISNLLVVTRDNPKTV
jgi:hypothetical protein